MPDVDRGNERLSDEQTVAAYRRIHPQYQALVEKLKMLVEDLLAAAQIDVVQVEARAKSPESFHFKLRDKGSEYEDPFHDVTDLIGLRVITYYLEDVVRVEGLIRREFDVDESNSHDRAAQLDPDRFGYLSSHFIVRAGTSRAKLTEWTGFAEKCAEIQVRTATQHAWAAIEHKLTYKSVREIPAELQRRLSRLSALFELADEQFSESKKAVDELEARYAEGVRQGDLDVAVDASSLEAYLTESESVRTFAELLTDQGISARDPEEDEERRQRDFRDLLRFLDRVDARSVKAIDERLNSETQRQRFARVVQALRASGEHLGDMFLEDWLGQYVLISEDVGIEGLRPPFTAEYAHALRAAMDEVAAEA